KKQKGRKTRGFEVGIECTRFTVIQRRNIRQPYFAPNSASTSSANSKNNEETNWTPSVCASLGLRVQRTQQHTASKEGSDDDDETGSSEDLATENGRSGVPQNPPPSVDLRGGERWEKKEKKEKTKRK